ncbi:protein FAM237A [Pleurodeles waltl]|uniref:protein FAM237A n=1 Tax=Pleurodeles waltl TaxID=8319 RepID=UPI0037093C8D
MDLVNRGLLHRGMRLTCSLIFLGMFCVAPTSSHVDPLALGRADPQCWESSSAILLEMRKPRISDTVAGFWDFMIYLKSSENLKHGALFWDLAQLFWDIYVDCVLSRTHGLGRRQLALTQPRSAELSYLFSSGLQILMSVSLILTEAFPQDQKLTFPEKRDVNEDMITVHVQHSGSRKLERVITDLITKRKQV